MARQRAIIVSVAKFGIEVGSVETVPITATNPFKGRQYPGDVMLQAVRWYLRYPLAYEHVAELLAERGLDVDASCIWRWVQTYSPELNKRCRSHLKRTNKCYRVDETYIKVKGQEKYLYRAVDSAGQTIDFLLSAKRDDSLREALLSKGIQLFCESDSQSHQCGQEPSLSSCSQRVKSGWYIASAGTSTSVQVSKQCH